jgi:hypothetical protein
MAKTALVGVLSRGKRTFFLILSHGKGAKGLFSSSANRGVDRLVAGLFESLSAPPQRAMWEVRLPGRKLGRASMREAGVVA